MANSDSAIRNLDNRREENDEFSFARSGKSDPTSNPKKRRSSSTERNWRLKHLAEK